MMIQPKEIRKEVQLVMDREKYEDEDEEERSFLGCGPAVPCEKWRGLDLRAERILCGGLGGLGRGKRLSKVGKGLDGCGPDEEGVWERSY